MSSSLESRRRISFASATISFGQSAFTKAGERVEQLLMVIASLYRGFPRTRACLSTTVSCQRLWTHLKSATLVYLSWNGCHTDPSRSRTLQIDLMRRSYSSTAQVYASNIACSAPCPHSARDGTTVRSRLSDNSRTWQSAPQTSGVLTRGESRSRRSAASRHRFPDHMHKRTRTAHPHVRARVMSNEKVRPHPLLGSISIRMRPPLKISLRPKLDDLDPI